MSRVSVAGLALPLLLLGGCGPRVIIATGTTLGIKATPGDGQTRPPQLVVGYKRAETALIPVEGLGATQTGNEVSREAASTLASFYLKNEWTSATQIRSFIGTGFAARNLIGQPAFLEQFHAATGVVPTPDVVERQDKLLARWAALNRDEAKAQKVLDVAGYPRKANKTAVDSLQDYIVTTRAPSALSTLEAAFGPMP